MWLLLFLSHAIHEISDLHSGLLVRCIFHHLAQLFPHVTRAAVSHPSAVAVPAFSAVAVPASSSGIIPAVCGHHVSAVASVFLGFQHRANGHQALHAVGQFVDHIQVCRADLSTGVFDALVRFADFIAHGLFHFIQFINQVFHDVVLLPHEILETVRFAFCTRISGATPPGAAGPEVFSIATVKQHPLGTVMIDVT